jgi:crotonobetainyl-CoA:carnitine CoA-transferase CaiB-like acyl-CoA transferase
MKVTMPYAHAESGAVDLVGSPLKLGATPVGYRHAPPRLGEHSAEVLRERLGLDDDTIARLAAAGVIG